VKQNKIFNIDYLLMVVYIFTVTLFITWFSWSTNLNYYKDNKIRVMTYFILTEGVDLDLMCTLTNCKYITHNGHAYRRDRPDSYIKATDINSVKVSYVTETLDIPSENITIYFETKRYNTITFIHFILSFLLMFILYTWYYVKDRIRTEDASAINLAIDGFRIEGKIQNLVATTAYHEMTTPISTMVTFMRELREDIATSIASVDNIKDIYSEVNYKKVMDMVSATNNIVSTHLDHVENSIAVLETVLSQMTTNKNLTANKDDMCLYTMIDTISTNQSILLAPNYFEYDIKDELILKEYGLDKLSNGGFMSILNNQITNAVEAGANTITFKVKKKRGEDVLSLLVIDNGGGIKLGGDIKEFNDIFKLGVSSKEKLTERTEHTCKLLILLDIIKSTKIFNYLKERYFKTSLSDKMYEIVNDNKTTIRGYGLFIIKNMLEEIGGSIEVVSSCSKGTVFSLRLPVRRVYV